MYVSYSFGSYIGMLFLVIHCILHLLVFTRCSVVFEEGTQEAKINQYCSRVGRCLPGTHVMCRFGDKKMGPRCDSGKPLPFQKEEENLVLDFINEFKRNLARGLVKYLPRAYGMIKLSWDNTLAEFAQAWANQCNGRSHDECRDSENFPRTWQILSRRFFNLDWSLKDVEFKDNAPRLTMEKRRKAIELLFNGIYQQKTPDLTQREIENHPGGKNLYLKAIHGPGSKVGCGMSSFLEYRRLTDDDPITYNTLLIVCNFSNEPNAGEKVYETEWVDGADWTPCGCPKGFYEDNYLCIKGDRKKDDKPKDKNDDKNNKPPGGYENQKIQKHDNSKEKQKRENSDRIQQDDNSKDKQKGDNDKDKQKGENSKLKQKGDNSTDKQNGDNSNKKEKGNSNIVNQKDDIKENKQKGDNSRGHKNKAAGKSAEENLSPRLVLLPIIDVENADQNRLQMHERKKKDVKALQRRSQRLRQGIKERVQNFRDRYFKDYVVLDPGTRLPQGGQVDEDTYILSKNGLKHTTNTILKQLKNVRSNKNKSHTEIKARRGFSDLDELVSEYLLNLHNDEVLNSTSDILYRPSNNMRESIGPQANIKKSKKNRFAYLNKGFNDLYDTEQNMNKIVPNKNFNEMLLNKAKENIADNFYDLQSSNTQVKGNLMDKIDFADNDIKENIWPKRYQNPINSQKYDTKNVDYPVQIENDQSYRNIDPQSMFILDDYNAFGNDERLLYDDQNAAFAYDANEVAQFYLYKLNEVQGHKLDTYPGRRLDSEIETKYRLDPSTETRHKLDTDIPIQHKLKHKHPIHHKIKSSKSQHYHHNARKDDHK